MSLAALAGMMFTIASAWAQAPPVCTSPVRILRRQPVPRRTVAPQ